jgi:hypothetical protein
MLHDAGVVLVPGMDFGVHAPRDYIRLSYATAYSRLEEAVERLASCSATTEPRNPWRRAGRRSSCVDMKKHPTGCFFYSCG